MIIGIYSQTLNEDLKLHAPSIVELLLEKGVQIKVSPVVHEAIHNGFQSTKFQIFEKIDEQHSIDLLLSLGGDGTILSSVTLVKHHPIPILGINLGRLGFLSSYTKDEFISEIDSILQKDFYISKRAMLCVAPVNTSIENPFALNEISISRKETTSMVTIDCYVDNQFLNTYWADGLIISTPTGSTGYNLSCGGPIINPETETIVITPIAPHNLNVRPITFSINSKVRLLVKSRAEEFSLSLDSRLTSLKNGSEIVIKRNYFDALLVFPKNYSHFDRLRKKLLWGIDSRN